MMPAAFLTPLVFRDDGGLPFTLEKPFRYITTILHNPLIEIQSGFVTDLASIPRPLWVLFPPVGKYDMAAVLHDFCYKYNGCTRKQADDILLEAMGVSHVSRFTRWSIYMGVRSGGWCPWNKYRAAETKATK